MQGIDVVIKPFHDSSQLHLSEHFWRDLIKKSLQFKEINTNQNGFYLMRGPYMDRTSVHALEFLKTSLSMKQPTALYLYLDGVHSGHANQQPSAFLNIGVALEKLLVLEGKSAPNFKMMACSRCSAARGYFPSENNHVKGSRNGQITGFSIVNLNLIIEELLHPNLILSPSSVQCGFPQAFQKNKPILNVIISHSPYGTEWAFGGLSLAIAAASNHQIPTRIIFIEDGVYTIIGDHQVEESDKVFNAQEIIEATLNDDNLYYYAYRESIERRVDIAALRFPEMTLISSEELAYLISSSKNLKNPQNLPKSSFSDKRIIRTLFF